MKVTAGYLERLARDYQSAYEAANDALAPPIIWQRGWFKINHARYRRKQVEEMRDTLQFRARQSQTEKS